MAIQRYYFDTSALIVRFLTHTPGYDWIHDICAPSNHHTLALAQVTGAELGAALNQLVRGGKMRKKTRDTALAAFWAQVSAGAYAVVPITDDVIRQAAGLCDKHPLRGYDAVQLSCALVAREDARIADNALVASGLQGLGDPIFLTEDFRLRDAAAAEGFVVDSPKAHTIP